MTDKEMRDKVADIERELEHHEVNSMAFGDKVEWLIKTVRVLLDRGVELKRAAP